MLIQELSTSQSSLFSQAMGTSGTITGGGGRGVVGSGGGRVPCSAIGGGRMDVVPGMGRMVASSMGGLSPATGGMGSNESTAIAEHFIFGWPVVPGGQTQVGRFPVV